MKRKNSMKKAAPKAMNGGELFLTFLDSEIIEESQFLPEKKYKPRDLIEQYGELTDLPEIISDEIIKLLSESNEPGRDFVDILDEIRNYVESLSSLATTLLELEEKSLVSFDEPLDYDELDENEKRQIDEILDNQENNKQYLLHDRIKRPV